MKLKVDELDYLWLYIRANVGTFCSSSGCPMRRILDQTEDGDAALKSARRAAPHYDTARHRMNGFHFCPSRWSKRLLEILGCCRRLLLTSSLTSSTNGSYRRKADISADDHVVVCLNHEIQHCVRCRKLCLDIYLMCGWTMNTRF